MARQENAGTIINRAAVEVGLQSVTDPFSTTDEGFTQLAQLLNVCGQELGQLRDWNELIRPFTANTTTDVKLGSTNLYELPSDYDRLIPQTGWDLTNDVPILGPMSPQDFAYLEGRDFASNSIYVAYRIYRGDIELYPDPPPANTDLSWEYVSRNWATTSGGTEVDYVTATNDIVVLDPLLMQKFLKVKFLDAKNLPSQAARMEFENIYLNRISNDNSAPVLNSGRSGRTFPYLSAMYNTPDTGFGS